MVRAAATVANRLIGGGARDSVGLIPSPADSITCSGRLNEPVISTVAIRAKVATCKCVSTDQQGTCRPFWDRASVFINDVDRYMRQRLQCELPSTLRNGDAISTEINHQLSTDRERYINQTANQCERHASFSSTDRCTQVTQCHVMTLTPTYNKNAQSLRCEAAQQNQATQ